MLKNKQIEITVKWSTHLTTHWFLFAQWNFHLFRIYIDTNHQIAIENAWPLTSKVFLRRYSSFLAINNTLDWLISSILIIKNINEIQSISSWWFCFHLSFTSSNQFNFGDSSISYSKKFTIEFIIKSNQLYWLFIG